MNRNASTRRRFLKSAAATSVLSARSWTSLIRGDEPSERIRVGVIGTGVRGKYLIGNLPEPARVVAVCDCAASRIAETLRPQKEPFRQVLRSFSERDGHACRTYRDYREMLERESLGPRTMDAVIIATPDHHHVQAAMLALNAGLHVYLEKPLTLTVREGRLLADCVHRSGRVLQVGSQQRTMELNRFACEFLRDGGLGKISHVEAPNYPGPMIRPAYPEQKPPPGLDWDLFLGPAPYVAHHRQLWIKDEFKVGELMWRGWDFFRDYSGHLMTNWGAHGIDMVQYALGVDATGPVRVTLEKSFEEDAFEAAWQERWFKKTPHPETLWKSARRFQPVSFEYAAGVKLHLRPAVKSTVFYGEKGTMTMSRNKFETDPLDLIPDAPDSELAAKWEGDGNVAKPHLQNWLDAIRGVASLNAPVEVGHRSITVCHLANLARQLGRSLRWDPDEEHFVGDTEADELLDRPRRKGFELPS